MQIWLQLLETATIFVVTRDSIVDVKFYQFAVIDSESAHGTSTSTFTPFLSHLFLLRTATRMAGSKSLYNHVTISFFSRGTVTDEGLLLVFLTSAIGTLRKFRF